MNTYTVSSFHKSLQSTCNLLPFIALFLHTSITDTPWLAQTQYSVVAGICMVEQMYTNQNLNPSKN